jgi:hypothetical protein
MLDDNKHSEAMKVWFTEREFHDLCALAIKDDRKPGEMLRVIVRRAMYGSVNVDGLTVHGANSPETN